MVLSHGGKLLFLLLACNVQKALSKRESSGLIYIHLVGLGHIYNFCCSYSVYPSLFQAKSCICHMCGAHLNRLHSCLYCVFFGCFTKKHIHEHAKTKRHNLGKLSSWCTHYCFVAHCVSLSNSRPVRWCVLVASSLDRKINFLCSGLMSGIILNLVLKFALYHW